MNKETSGSETPPVVIKKYANRRLYNTATSSYVTLDDLSSMVKQGGAGGGGGGEGKPEGTKSEGGGAGGAGEASLQELSERLNSLQSQIEALTKKQKS